MPIASRRERDLHLRRELILSAATEIAEAEGWSAVTTRRLADQIEYSQPVIYSHFSNKQAIVDAVAEAGFIELTKALHGARHHATPSDPIEGLLAVASAYTDFAVARRATYEAMFVMSTDTEFASDATPEYLRAAFGELQSAIVDATHPQDPETITELFWSALHGLTSLDQAHRLRPDFRTKRLRALIESLST